MARSGSVTPLQAAEERILRTKARRHLCDFGEYVYPWWHAYDMHRLIGAALERVLDYLRTDGKEGTGRLIILTPPQHGKSEEVSRLFPGFALGQLSDLRIFLVSYGADLATGNSRAVRNLVISNEYQALFGQRSASAEPVELSSDSRSSSEWDLARPHRGGIIASGVNGSISGRARGLVIIDDPLKGHKEAQSADVREDIWEFWVSTMRPRTQAAVLVMTHWHPDDLAGRFLAQMATKSTADQWEVLMLPGLAFEAGEYAKDEEEQRKRMQDGIYLPTADPLQRQPGEVLCAAMFSKEEMVKAQEADDFWFTALYQQLPYMREGQFFKRDWLKVIPQVPAGVKLTQIVFYWDKAGSKEGDYTVGVLMGKGSDGCSYVLEVVRGRWLSYERDQKMLQAVERATKEYAPTPIKVWHQQDPGSAGLDSALATQQLFAGYAVRFEPATGSKEDRADPFASACQGDKVRLLKGAWNTAYIEELASFNRGKHDDQVDGSSGAYNKLRSPAPISLPNNQPMMPSKFMQERVGSESVYTRY